MRKIKFGIVVWVTIAVLLIGCTEKKEQSVMEDGNETDINNYEGFLTLPNDNDQFSADSMVTEMTESIIEETEVDEQNTENSESEYDDPIDQTEEEKQDAENELGDYEPGENELPIT